MICDACQRELPEPKVLGPTRCKCGNWIDAGFAVACTHRGPRLGQASCGCGAVYECRLLGGICSPRPPVDEWATVTINGEKREIRDLDYRCCRGCAEFVSG